MLPLFLGCFYPILFILAGNDGIHESSDKFEIWPDPTSGFHGNRLGYNGKKWCCHFFLAVFYLILFILTANDDMQKFEIRPDPTTDCGVSCP